MEALVIAAAEAPPAGGAALGQIIIATVAANLLAGALAWVGMAHRAGRRTPLGALAAFSERVSGLPAWAAIPGATVTGSLIIALFGMLWDISLHIADGRDEGPLANPAHYFILAGLFGVFAAGFLSMVLPRGKPSESAVRIRGDWYAPLGGVLITACGAFALIGFPLDDVWHRLFGQDVTLWGPTHLMLITGAAMTLVGLAVLLVEARRAQEASDSPRLRREPRWVAALRHVALPGAFLLGLSTFQAEFDFGVPQFRFVFEPMMVMLAAGASLVAARAWLGRGAAIGAALFFLAVRGLMALIVGPVLGEPTPYFPLYLVEAIVVELVALRVSPRRPVAFGAAAGAAVGTVGLAAEWAWSHAFMPLPWPSALLPEAALAGFAVALAGSLIGAWIGTRLNADELPGGRTPALRYAAVASAAVLAGLTGWALNKPADEGVRASVVLEEAGGGAERHVNATVTIAPADAADDAEWLTATAWQGGGLVVDRLEKVGPGTYRTTEPLPVHGTWKSLIRLHHGRSLAGVPVFLPEDPAIPAEGVPAPARFTRTFEADHEILQREQKGGSPGLVAAGYGSVIAIALGFLGLLAWGVHRVAARPGAAAPPQRKAAARRRPLRSPVRAVR